MILKDFQPRLAHNLVQHPTITAWLSERVVTGLKLSSAESYAYSMIGFVKFCQVKKLNYVRAKESHVLRYLAYLQKRPFESDSKLILKKAYATATQRKSLIALRLYFGYLIEKKYGPHHLLLAEKIQAKLKKANLNTAPYPSSVN